MRKTMSYILFAKERSHIVKWMKFHSLYLLKNTYKNNYLLKNWIINVFASKQWIFNGIITIVASRF